jgi:hypothetical protein
MDRHRWHRGFWAAFALMGCDAAGAPSEKSNAFEVRSQMQTKPTQRHEILAEHSVLRNSLGVGADAASGADERHREGNG